MYFSNTAAVRQLTLAGLAPAKIARHISSLDGSVREYNIRSVRNALRDLFPIENDAKKFLKTMYDALNSGSGALDFSMPGVERRMIRCLLPVGLEEEGLKWLHSTEM